MQKLETAHQLQSRLTTILATVEREFGTLSEEQLRWKPAPDKWSIIECLQHLNLAERFYIRNIQHKVERLGLIQSNPSDQVLEAGLVGRVLCWLVDPNTKLKVKAPSIIKPRRADEWDVRQVLGHFVELQTLLHDSIDRVVYLDWNKTKLSTLFGNWLKIRLGDAMRMLVLHTERHLNQAMRVKETMGGLDLFLKEK